MLLKTVDTNTITIKMTKREFLAIINSVGNLNQEVDELEYTTLLGVGVDEIRNIKTDMKIIYNTLQGT
jgi:hypothetical protein